MLQQRRKAQLQMEAFSMSKTDLVAVGEKDISLGVDWFFQTAQQYSLPLISSNLSCEGYQINPEKDFVVDGVRIVFHSLINPKQNIDGCTVGDPVTSIENLRNDSVNILLSQLTTDQLKSVLETRSFDIVIDSKNGKKIDVPEPIDLDSILLGPGKKGKFVGYAQMEVREGVKGFQAEGMLGKLKADNIKWESRIQSIEDRFKNDENLKGPGALQKKERKISFYKEQLQKNEEQISQLKDNGPANLIKNKMYPLGRDVKDWPGLNEPVAQAKEDINNLAKDAKLNQYNGVFVGSQRCQSCHQNEYKQWMTTPHSKAWTTLKANSREMDLECYACHSTGSFHPKGPSHPKQLGVLINVGCESCHGPGRDHLKAPSKKNIEKSVAVEVCVECHDGVKDEGRFDEKEYWPRIIHESSGD